MTLGLNFLIPVLFFFMGFILHGQGKYIELIKTKNGRQKTIEEGARIKIKTFDGKKHIGKLVLIDSRTVSVDDIAIPLGDIVSIKRKSAEAAAFSTFFYVLGAAGLVLGTAGIIAGGFNVLAALVAYPAAILFSGLGAAINNPPQNHPASKWRYKIIYDE